jgi:hypothetical protein
MHDGEFGYDDGKDPRDKADKGKEDSSLYLLCRERLDVPATSRVHGSRRESNT